ncbi:GNAT family N-acetyltransferase [Clostridium sp. 'deep sea']|uniref:GNAT family N-acetyltransferase n=1 Tax=Clostridium sp. 'deep sea' TaxID=2779445 RepID=UPI001896898A|nr:GNAT family N-acetyltransferase [Clostridium sp. 'deep sea']QOR34972.1 GNAT family N-acetyltransferase [Clostridium sp. 'deep sea']
MNKRLSYKIAGINDCEILTNIAYSWSDYKLMGGQGFKPNYIYKCVTEGDLPPIEGASKDNYTIKVIIDEDSNKIIGYYDYYMGYPNEHTLWIGMMIIAKKYRKAGYGKECFNNIIKEAKEKGAQRIGLAVYLKNWPALNFWFKQGFSKIIGIYGDQEYSESNYSTIALQFLM